MSEPPIDEKGGAGAATPTPPDRVSSLAGIQNSRRQYRLNRRKVNPRPGDGGASGSSPATADAENLSAAERKYLEICQAGTGRDISPESKQKQEEDRALLLQQSYRIADALESQGIKAYGPSKLTLVGILSGKVVELPDFRNIVFIPSVAQRKRHQLLKQLEFFMQKHRFSRMWVFTTGHRTPLPEVRERISWLHRRLSKLNAQPFMKAAGCALVFRSTELGEIDRAPDRTPTFHIHAHVIVHLQRKLSRDAWSQLLKSVRGWWKFHFKDAQCIHQAREACKYVVKPGDLDKLKDEELAELHRQLFKLHLVQCLGKLKELRAQLKDTDCKLVRIGNEPWEMVPNWNRGRPARDTEEIESFEGREPDDWVLCTLPPSCAVSMKAEPLAVVLNYSGQRIDENRRIRRLREICGSNYKDG